MDTVHKNKLSNPLYSHMTFFPTTSFFFFFKTFLAGVQAMFTTMRSDHCPSSKHYCGTLGKNWHLTEQGCSGKWVPAVVKTAQGNTKCNVSVTSWFALWLNYWAVQAGLLTPLTFARHRLSPSVAFTSSAYFLHNGRRWQWICCSCCRMPQNVKSLVNQKTMQTLFFYPPSPFPGNFCNCNSGGICTASQF